MIFLDGVRYRRAHTGRLGTVRHRVLVWWSALHGLRFRPFHPAGLGLDSATFSGARPDLIGDPQTGAPHTISEWFNTSAFAFVPTGQIRPGNEKRGTIVGPPTARWDADLFKNTKLNERFDLQFRAEALNVLNHTNLDTFLSTRFGSSLFGKIGTARDPRIMQLALKLIF
jgi:hypothetical protein